MIAVGDRVEHTGYPEQGRPVWVVDELLDVDPYWPGSAPVALCHREDQPEMKARYWPDLFAPARTVDDRPRQVEVSASRLRQVPLAAVSVGVDVFVPEFGSAWFVFGPGPDGVAEVGAAIGPSLTGWVGRVTVVAPDRIGYAVDTPAGPRDRTQPVRDGAGERVRVLILLPEDTRRDHLQPDRIR